MGVRCCPRGQSPGSWAGSSPLGGPLLPSSPGDPLSSSHEPERSPHPPGLGVSPGGPLLKPEATPTLQGGGSRRGLGSLGPLGSPSCLPGERPQVSEPWPHPHAGDPAATSPMRCFPGLSWTARWGCGVRTRRRGAQFSLRGWVPEGQGPSQAARPGTPPPFGPSAWRGSQGFLRGPRAGPRPRSRTGAHRAFEFL